MAVEYTTQIGYGFVLEALETEENLSLGEVHDIIWENIEFEHLSIELVGDLMSGVHEDLIAFLLNPSPKTFGRDSQTSIGASVIDKEVSVPEGVLKELDMLKKYVRVLSTEPQIIATFTIN